MADMAVINLLTETVPVSGVTDSTVNVTGTAALLSGSVTINPGCEIVQLQPTGGSLYFRDDGGTPTTSSGFFILEGTVWFTTPDAFSTLRVVGYGADTPVLRISQRQYRTSSVRRAADLSVSMRSIKFDDVYNWILRKLGVSTTAWLASASPHDKEAIADSINDRLRRIWEMRWWPDLTLNEERDMDDSGDFPVIPFSASGEVNIGQVRAVFTGNPFDPSVSAAAVPFELSAAGIAFHSSIETDTLWVRHLMRVHRFTKVAYDAGTAYAAGDIVYYASTGECYECIVAGTGNAPTNTAYWSKQRIPFLFADYVKFGALADVITGTKPEQFAVWEQRANDEAFRLIQQLPQQYQGETAAVRVA